MKPTTVAQASARRVPVAPARVKRRRLVRTFASTLLFAGDMATVFSRGLVPGNWRRTMREDFVRHFYQVCIRAIPAVLLVSVLIGLGLVLQLIYWLEVAAQGSSVGDFLVLLVVREIAPALAALLVIGRSSAVMLDEVGQWRIKGQLRMLESQGIDLVDFILLPRCFATALALFVLTVLLVYTALITGYLGAAAAGLTVVSAVDFADQVLSNMGLGDHLMLLVKPLTIGFVLGGLAAWLGMRVEQTATGIRQAFPKAFVTALLATFTIMIVLSAVL